MTLGEKKANNDDLKNTDHLKPVSNPTREKNSDQGHNSQKIDTKDMQVKGGEGGGGVTGRTASAGSLAARATSDGHSITQSAEGNVERERGRTGSRTRRQK